MRKVLLSSVGVVSLLVASGPSFSADFPVVAAPQQVFSPQLALDWDGYYVGGHLGLGQAWFDTVAPSDSSDIAETEPGGLVGGMQFGRNWQMNTFVVGFEADLSATGWSDDSVFTNSSRTIDNDVNWLASLRGRLGLPLDRTLLYVTGGIAYIDGDFFQVSPGGTTAHGNNNTIGGVIGLGAEWKQNQHISWKLEGLYYLFDDSKNFGHHSTGVSILDDAFVIRGGMNYHYSDPMLKRDVTLLKRLAGGLNLYRYRYLWGDEVYVGVMANEVERIMPSAVRRDSSGRQLVDYNRLGLKLLTLSEWARLNPGYALTA